MMPTNNPTAVSAVMGGRFAVRPGRGRVVELARTLAMPVVVAAFATYLLVGLLTMEVPAGTAFPGPRFFPALIAGGLYLFAGLLAAGAIREARAARSGPRLDPDPEGSASDADPDDAEAAPRPLRIDGRSLAWVVGSFLAFALLLSTLGWVIGAALLFWCVARGFGAQRPLLVLVAGLTVSSITYIAFDMLLGMPLPSGILGGEF